MMCSKIKGKRSKIPVGDNINIDDQKPEVYHDFWKKAPEDLLLEIFVRLPHFQSAVGCSTVCRLWHSLIINNHRFIPRFMSHHHQHQDRYPPLSSHTIIFRGIHSPSFQTFSKEWMFLHGKLSKSNFLDFFPHPMRINASCNDLLLVWSKNNLYVCNPITKQYVQLPNVPDLDFPLYWFLQLTAGYGLLCVPPSPNDTSIKFQVIEVIPPYDTFPLTVRVFCSESRNWEKRNFHYTSQISHFCSLINYYSVTCNGVLYLLEDDYPVLFYLDLLKDHCGVIDFPPTYSPRFRHRRFRHSIGVVCVPGGEPELRLIQAITNPEKVCAHLNVWRLDHKNDGDTIWFSVHDQELKGPANVSSNQQEYICLPFLHPTNSYLVFLIWDKTCFQFNLITGKYKMIDEVPDNEITDLFVPFPMAFSYGTSYLADMDC